MILQERKKKKRRRRKAMGFLIFLLFIAAIVSILLTVFRTEKIEIEGNEIYSDDTIRSTILAQEHSEYTWYLWAKYNFFAKENMPFVEEMEVRFTSPSSLTFTVYEKAVIGCVQSAMTDAMDEAPADMEAAVEEASPAASGDASGNARENLNSQKKTGNENAIYNYFDKDGVIIEQSSRLLEDTVEITGIRVENPTLYETMQIEDSDLLNYILTITQCMEKYGLTAERLQVGDYGKVDLILGNVTIKLGKNSLTEEKIMRLAAIYENLEGKSGTMDLEDWENDTGSLIFKENSDD